MKTKSKSIRRPALSAIETIEQARPSDFLITREYRRFAEFCRNCAEDRYIGICSGPPGIGKTVAARFYSQWDRLLMYRQRMSDNTPAFVRNCRTIYYTPTISNTPAQIQYDLADLRRRQTLSIKAALNEYDPEHEASDLTELIIVDEADRLRFTSIEQLRDIYDHGDIGLIFIGMPGLARRFSRFAQLHSRVGFVHEFRCVSTAELKKLLANELTARRLLKLKPGQGVDDDAYAAIARVTAGNFRLIDRLAAQMQRIMKLNNLRWVNREVVATARNNLLIGNN